MKLCTYNASNHHHLINMSLFLFIILILLRGKESNVGYVEPPLGMTKYFHLAPPIFYLIFISPTLNHPIRDDKILSSRPALTYLTLHRASFPPFQREHETHTEHLLSDPALETARKRLGGYTN